MSDFVVVKKINFKVSTQDKHIEFAGEGLADEELKSVVDVFATAVMSGEACEAPEDEDMIARLRGFLPPDIQVEEEDHPDNANYLETGIRHKKTANGWVPTYRVRYQCPNKVCNNTGNRYVEKDTKTTKCHNCSERMEIRQSTPEGFPNKDAYGNFYHAGDEIR